MLINYRIVVKKSKSIKKIIIIIEKFLTLNIGL